MNILEDLKKQAEKRRQDIEQSSQQSSGLHVIRSMQIVNGLQLIHSYLHEFIEQLNYVEPQIKVDMPLDHFGALENLQQGDYKLLYESSYNRELVCLFFSLNNDSKLEVEIPDEAGKSTMEIMVTGAEGGRISFGTATKRYWAKVISLLILLAGFIMIGFTARRQGLHDIIARCLVVTRK